jgi:hypothetical protein
MRRTASVRAALPVAAVIIWAVAFGPGCAARETQRNDFGIPRCPAAAADALLSPDALQCWFDAQHGRWRILSHVSFHDALVVEVEARSLNDADEIARRFTAGESGLFSEILVYTQTEPGKPSSRVRRVRWTRSAGYDMLEFASS